jgi:hypothetical protein
MALVPGPGQPGEYSEAVVASGSATSLSTGTAKTVVGATISLQPGIWEVKGVIDFQFGATTSYTQLQAGLSTTTDTLDSAQDHAWGMCAPATVPTAALDITVSVPSQTVTVRVATTYQLVAKATFTVSTLKAYGKIYARRIR